MANPTRQTYQVGTLKEYLDNAPELLQDSESYLLSHTTATAMVADAYQQLFTTDGSGTALQVFTPGDPATVGIIGQRHLLKLALRANAADTVSVDKTRIKKSDDLTTPTAVTLSSVGDWALLEHRGDHWIVIAFKAGVVT